MKHKYNELQIEHRFRDLNSPIEQLIFTTYSHFVGVGNPAAWNIRRGIYEPMSSDTLDTVMASTELDYSLYRMLVVHLLMDVNEALAMSLS